MTPTQTEAAILQRAALGYIKLTFTADGPKYSYDDGTPLPLRCQKQFNRMIENGWLTGDRDSLFDDGPPQIYRISRKLEKIL